MIRMLRFAGGALAALLLGALLTACGAATPAPTATATRTATPTPTGTPTPAPTLTAAPATGSAAPFVIAPEIAALMRSAPSPEDGDFTPDSARLVGATGRPQLIEVFSYD
jgi:hypothetical protein